MVGSLPVHQLLVDGRILADQPDLAWHPEFAAVMGEFDLSTTQGIDCAHSYLVECLEEAGVAKDTPEFNELFLHVMDLAEMASGNVAAALTGIGLFMTVDETAVAAA